MSEEQTQHPEEPAEGSQEGVEALSEEEAQPRTGDATPPVKEEEVREEDAAPAAGSEASPGGGEQEEK